MADDDDDEEPAEGLRISVPNVYARLGVDSEATAEEIERATELWLTEARAFGTSDEEVEAVLGAYAVASDPLRRSLYDALVAALRLAEWLSLELIAAREGGDRPAPQADPSDAEQATGAQPEPTETDRTPPEPTAAKPTAAEPSAAEPRPAEPMPPIEWGALRPPSSPRPSPSIVPLALPTPPVTTYSFTGRELAAAVEVFERVPDLVATARAGLELAAGADRRLSPGRARGDRGRSAAGPPPLSRRPPSPRQERARWPGTLLAVAALVAMVGVVPRFLGTLAERDEIVAGDAPRRLIAATPCDGDRAGPAAATALDVVGDRWVAEVPIGRPEGSGATEVTLALTGASAVVDTNGDDVVITTIVRWRRAVEPRVAEPAEVDDAVVHARADFRDGVLQLSWPTSLHADADGHRWRVEYSADGITTSCRSERVVR